MNCTINRRSKAAAEFVRLPLEDAGADYLDVARDPNFGRPGIVKFLEDPSLEHPPFAPPFLKAGKLLISQTANILQFLAPRLGLVPKNEASRLWAHQLQLTIADWLYEAGQTHTIRSRTSSTTSSRRTRPKSAPRISSQRAFQNFSAILKNPQTERQRQGLRFRQESLLRRSLAVPDDRRVALRFSKDDGATRIATPRMVTLHDRVRARPRIAAYLSSPRRLAFNEQGIFRHYPELEEG